MLNIFKKSQNRKRFFQAMIFIVIIAVFFVNIKFALAADTFGGDIVGVGNYIIGGVGYAVATVLAVIALVLTTVIGLLITVVVAVLITVAQYNNIINVPTVIQGWVIIRDLCNMFFILILLIIAFATILRQENFSAKKMLPKLLIMAVLINFSRTIFGLLIDISQIIMLTFVNAFAAGGGWFMQAFNTNWLLSMAAPASTGGDFAVSTWSTAVAIIAGVLAAIITLIVVSVMLAVLVARIVMLWIYTIFSPLIFLGFAFTPLQKYTGKLWEDFTKQLVVGPVLAFFIWLALSTAQTSTKILSGQNLANLSGKEICVGIGAFFCEGRFQQFIIVIGLLMGGLMVAQSMGGAAGSIAGKGLDWAKKAGRLPLAPIKKIPQVSSWAARKFAFSKHGFEIRPTKIWGGIKEALEEKKRKEDIAIEQKSASMLQQGKLRGALGSSRVFAEDAARGFLWNRAWKISGDPKNAGVIQSTFMRGMLNRVVKNEEKEKQKMEEERAELVKKKGVTPEQIKTKQDAIDDTETLRTRAAIAGDIKEYDRQTQLAKDQREELRLMEREVKSPMARAAIEKEIADVDLKLKDKDKTIATAREEALKYRTPNTFYARQKSLAAAQEASRKSGIRDNAEEIVDNFDDATRRGDKEMAIGMYLHAFDVYHGNEMLQLHKAKKNVYGDDGELVTKEGGYFDQSPAAMRAFREQYLQDGLGLSEQEALFYQSHASSIAKERKHMNLAETVGVKNGLFFQRTDKKVADIQNIEAMKQDAERMGRDYNRIGQGNERAIVVGRDKQGKDIIERVFAPNDYTIKNFIKLAPLYDLEVNDRKRFNANFAENIFNNYLWRQKQPDKMKDRSLIEIMRQFGTSYTPRGGGRKTHEQLALEATLFGGDKKIADLIVEKLDKQISGADPAEIAALDEEIKDVQDIIDDLRKQIAAFPPPASPKKP